MTIEELVGTIATLWLSLVIVFIFALAIVEAWCWNNERKRK